MILVIPSIDLKDGKCCSCISGETGTEDFYESISELPERLVALLRRENSKALHFNDFDSFENGCNNSDLLIQLSYITDIPFQLYTCIKHYEACHHLLNKGIYRLILSPELFDNEVEIEKLIDKFTASRIVFYYDSNILNTDILFQKALKTGLKRVYFVNNSEDINESINSADSLFGGKGIRVTLGSFTGGPKELWQLNSQSPILIDSVAIGRPLFENSFPCQKIWRLAEAKLEK